MINPPGVCFAASGGEEGTDCDDGNEEVDRIELLPLVVRDPTSSTTPASCDDIDVDDGGKEEVDGCTRVEYSFLTYI